MRIVIKKCYDVNRFSFLEKGQFSQHRPQEVMQKKWYHVNVFSECKNGQFSQRRPQEVMQKYLIR